jgi:5-methyltetrahydropteroyltriglutamate--homocysteine methyltransferase
MAVAGNLGYPRLGAKRELKWALESYWSGKISATELWETGRQLRLTHWKIQREAGIAVIPSNDFSFYDHVLDTTLMVGAIPKRYFQLPNPTNLALYFAMARGSKHGDLNLPALEMTKWFDTNYHYIVPEIERNQSFKVLSTKVVEEFVEAAQAGIHTRPILLGPVSYLLLSKATSPDYSPLDALPELIPIYVDILQRLISAGADWVQIDEPCLVLDLDEKARRAYIETYHELGQITGIKLMLATYFGDLGENLSLAIHLPVAGLHIDLVRGSSQLRNVLAGLPNGIILSLGVIDGRNVWRADLDAAFAKIQQAVFALGSERVQIAPSCSLMFSPHDLDLEQGFDDELHSWLAFARQKLQELAVLEQAINHGINSVTESFSASRRAMKSRQDSPQTRDLQVRARLDEVDQSMLQRHSEYRVRKPLQAQRLSLPLLPTTTIGSFPQTAEIRAHRSARNRGTLTQNEYDEFMRAEIARVIRLQESMGLDVLVHGEFERTDMVEYFGERLTGIAFSQHGWVQSYGSRAVRPPIIFGDVSRPAPMTVSWSVYAQSLTDKPVKGMLTGPITILEWSFVRDDQPRELTCRQIALAIREEVLDLERAGIQVIQIDEPAFREGLPLRKAEQETYLQWTIECFRLASGGVRDDTQIHTHMCYAEFNEIIEAIGRMDADVISVEASRSRMELLDAFQQYQYPGDIGPGIYDIHSPNIPSQAEMEALIEKAARIVPIERLWINPDCGLKTRHWEEVIPSVRNLVGAVHVFRQRHDMEVSSPN